MTRLNYIPVRDPKAPHRFHPDIRKLYREKAFGVYVIKTKRKNGRPQYVGESSGKEPREGAPRVTSEGRLYHTVTRHFQSWTGPQSRQSFDPMTHEIAIIKTRSGAAAIRLQDRLIGKLDPVHNLDEQQAPEAPQDEVPF